MDMVAMPASAAGGADTNRAGPRVLGVGVKAAAKVCSRPDTMAPPIGQSVQSKRACKKRARKSARQAQVPEPAEREREQQPALTWEDTAAAAVPPGMSWADAVELEAESATAPGTNGKCGKCGAAYRRPGGGCQRCEEVAHREREWRARYGDYRGPLCDNCSEPPHLCRCRWRPPAERRRDRRRW